MFNFRWMMVAFLMSLAASSAQAALVVGQSIGLDFGAGATNVTPGSGAEANFLQIDGGALNSGPLDDLATTDTIGGSTMGVTVSLTQIDGGTLNNVAADVGYAAGGVGTYGPGNPFSDLTFNDGIFIRDVPGPVGTTDELVVTFSGLDDSLTYDVQSLVTARQGAGGALNRILTTTVGGISGGQSFADAQGVGDVNTPLLLTGTSTDGMGNLVVRFTHEEPIVSLAGLHITAAVAIPEPGVAFIASLGVIGMFTRRRRA